MKKLQDSERVTGKRLVIVDGAAFGSEMKEVSEYLALSGQVVLYAPESFEWILLSANVVPKVNVRHILQDPADYIDSKQFASWERFFTELLADQTRGDIVWNYSKKKLPRAYLSPRVMNAVKRFMKVIVWE